MRYKYPRTPHLPWSPGATIDDVRHISLKCFEGKNIVITEKMDGENTTIYSDYLHARSIDSRFHPSRSWVKSLQAQIGYQIPEGWRICGENLYAQHSIGYKSLPSYFLAFSVWDEQNHCLSWDESKLLFAQLGLDTPRELYVGPWDEHLVRSIVLDTEKQEGFVVRNTDGFAFSEFSQNVAKWVRENHVLSDEHWMHKPVVPNRLKEMSDEES
ncbi:RNA ligase family protein [Marinobacterium jannaschii]|uniref:RNA ligase family protein n=1 Tax=Marinobacterium jannaschii TaxID=64970 RepID=UPI0004872368|nr:RNA ligase family protein [Marinobacterium jannaschii]